MVKFIILSIILNVMVKANGVNFYLNRAPSDSTYIPSIEQQIVAKMIKRKNGLGRMNLNDLVKYQKMLKNIHRKPSSKNGPKNPAKINRMRNFRQRHLSTN